MQAIALQPRRGDAVLNDGSVRYLLRRLISKAHAIFSHWRNMTRAYARENGLDDWEEPWRLTLPTIALWNTYVQRGMADELRAEVPDIETVMDFAYVLYVRRNFGKDAYGNINILDAESPPFAEVYHAFLTRLAATPEIVYNIALDRPADLERACENALCDALRDVACPRVSIKETLTPQQFKARAAMAAAAAAETGQPQSPAAPPAAAAAPPAPPVLVRAFAPVTAATQAAVPIMTPVPTAPVAPAAPVMQQALSLPSLPSLPSLQPVAAVPPLAAAASIPCQVPRPPKRKPRSRTKSPCATHRATPSVRAKRTSKPKEPVATAALPVAPLAAAPATPAVPCQSVANKVWKDKLVENAASVVSCMPSFTHRVAPAVPPAAAPAQPAATATAATAATATTATAAARPGFPLEFAVPSQLHAVMPNDSSSQLNSLGARYQLKTQGSVSHASRRSAASSSHEPRTVRFDPLAAGGKATPAQLQAAPVPAPAALVAATQPFGTTCAQAASDLLFTENEDGDDDDEENDGDDGDLGSGLERSYVSTDTQSCVARPQHVAATTNSNKPANVWRQLAAATVGR